MYEKKGKNRRIIIENPKELKEVRTIKCCECGSEFFEKHIQDILIKEMFDSEEKTNESKTI